MGCELLDGAPVKGWRPLGARMAQGGAAGGLALTPTSLGVHFISLDNLADPVPVAFYGNAGAQLAKLAKTGALYGSSGPMVPVAQMAATGNQLVLASYAYMPTVLRAQAPWNPRQVSRMNFVNTYYGIVAASGGRVALSPQPDTSLFDGINPQQLALCHLEADGSLKPVAFRALMPSVEQIEFAGDLLCLANGASGLRLLKVNADKNAVQGWTAFQ